MSTFISAQSLSPSAQSALSGLELTAQALAPFRPRDDRQSTSGQYRRIVRLLEHRTHCIRAVEPPALLGALDGIQARALAARVDHRDVTWTWIAAGTVSGMNLLDHHRTLALVCSQTDEPAVTDAAQGVPVTSLPEITPWALALATDELIDTTRRTLEATALEAAPSLPGQVLVVDGSLPPDGTRSDAVGVVKRATDTDWLPDPELIPTEEGWRSPALLIPATRMNDRAKITAFVRLRTATSSHAWTHCLVRVEVYEDSPVTIDAAAALAYRCRGSAAYGDQRWQVQLEPVWRTEQVLKAQVPCVIRNLA